MDEKTRSYINLYAVLGALEQLCALDAPSRALIADKRLSLGFFVKDGPAASLRFEGGACRMVPDVATCDILLPFKAPKTFNGMMGGSVTPVPTRGFWHAAFLTKVFRPLTDRLSACAQPSAESLRDPAFFDLSTTVMFHIVASAVSQVANNDKIGRFSASNIVDGDILLEIQGGPSATISARGHVLTTTPGACKAPRAVMRFRDMRTAHALFIGEANAVACIGTGEVQVQGMISMLDNVNRLLDRVSAYLA